MSDETPPGGTADADSEQTELRRRHLEHRRERLGAYLDESGLDAVWVARPNSFAWLTGGSNVVDRDADVGVAAAGYTRADGFRVVTDNIEAERLADEELSDAFDVESVPWHESSLADAVAAVTDGAGAADFDVTGFEPLDASRLRRPLSSSDIDRYRELARDVAAAVERVARELQPEDTEHEVAAGLQVTLASQGIESPVLLVGGGERAQSYRHYTPTLSELGEYALVSVVGERGGLYASTTRTVAFDDAPAWLHDRHEKAMQIEATALDATLRTAAEGGTSGDVFDGIREAYDAVGEPEEWQKHHQGGAAGFASREWLATPDGDDPVETPLAYAYNPTVSGAKSEDTVLLADGDSEVLTETGEWPTRTVDSQLAGEFSIERHEVLELGS